MRYVKLGEGGRWWAASKELGQIHAGWSGLPSELIAARDFPQIEALLRESYGGRPGATQDFNMLRSILDRPSQHIWFTFEDGYLWWCTATDDIQVNRAGSTPVQGHFWVECDRAWSNRSLGGRLLSMADLPGTVTATAGYRATTCAPSAASQIRRILLDEHDPDVAAAQSALEAHQSAIAKLIQRLGPKDFEVLVDLLLARSGWTRVAKLGGATEGIDVEVENAATNERAFVQVKSAASQTVLDDYVDRFQQRLDRYDRMIFAVHSPRTRLELPTGQPIQIWDIAVVSQLTVRLGFSDWVASRF